MWPTSVSHMLRPTDRGSCVGYRIAIAEMILTIGNMLRCFDPVLAGVLDLTPKYHFVEAPREPVKLRLRHRVAVAAVLESA